MPNLHNKWLYKNIVNILIPALQDMGFEWKRQRAAREVGREIVLGMPFGSLRRRNKNSIEIVEIHLRKRDRSFFNLHIGLCPIEGARDYLQGEHYDVEDIMTGYLEESWAMSSCPKFYMHFGFRFKSLRDITEADYEKLVRRVVSYLPEVEEALASGKVGRHMSFVKIPRQYE